MRVLGLVLGALALVAAPAAAQNFPALSGRVVDAADLLNPQQEAELTARLEALETASSRQLVVATIPSLEGRPIEDYGYQLGRHWQIGQSQANNGTILIVAPNDRKVRVEVGYGLEPIITDALSHQIVQNDILPRFREDDYAGGIIAGTNALIEQLGAPPEQAEQRALQAAEQQGQQSEDGGSLFGLIFWVFVLSFVVLQMFRRGRRGRRYGRRRRGPWGAPVVIWGGGSDWGSSGGGWGGFGGGGGGFGGFSGGGGSFGGGGASGSW